MRRVIVFGALLLVGLAFARSFGLMDRDHRVSEAWTWRGDVPADGWLHVRNQNGGIRIEETSGSEIEVIASKAWTGRRAQEVEFIANRVGENVYICALYGGGNSSDCDEDSYRSHEIGWLKRRVFRVRPVTTAFTIRVPATARVQAETRDGRVSSDAPLAALVATTRNGTIKAEEPVGMLKASSRNGSVSAVIADGPLAGDVSLSTRNGSVTLEMPESVDANVSMTTRHGRLTTDFPLTMEKLENANVINGILGDGGPKVVLETRNGSVRLKKRPDSGVPVEAPESPVAPVAPVAAVDSTGR